MPLTHCYLSAARLGLIDYLEQRTGIDWQYYDSSISPNDGARGGVRVFQVNDAESGGVLVMEHQAKIATAQLRILLAHSSADELESLLADWSTWIDTELHTLAFEGLSGVYRDIELFRALKGIRQSSRGCQFATEEISGSQGEEDRAWKGILLAEYQWSFEVRYQI